MNIDLGKCYSALANETRLRCFYLVAVNEEACVCEIVEALKITQPSASKALNTLKDVGLLRVRRESNWNYFSLDHAMPEWAQAIVGATVAGLATSRSHMADNKRFKRLELRGDGSVCK